MFAIGTLGILTMRNGIMILMSIEIMINAANINFVAFSSFSKDFSGYAFALFSIALAAAEAAVGLSILINLFRLKRSIEVDRLKLLKG